MRATVTIKEKQQEKRALIIIMMMMRMICHSPKNIIIILMIMSSGQARPFVPLCKFALYFQSLCASTSSSLHCTSDYYRLEN